ncbi:MAG: ABC transporter substrate-binding protein [Ktedonobacteraceae bacterium]
MYLPISRRRFLAQSSKAALSASLASSLLAACGGSQAPTGGGSKIAGTVKYWIGLDDAKQRQYIKQHSIDAFMKAYPDVRIDLSFKPIDGVDRLIQIALPAGKGPDIVPTPGPSYALQYITAKLLRDLDDYAAQYKWKDNFLGWALDSGRVNGKLYSLPGSYETMLIYYNKTLFTQKGWKPPTNRTELETLAEECMGQGILPFIAGSADWRPATEWFVTVFLNHYAGPSAVYQALTGQIPWTNPVFVDAIALMNSYFQKGWFGGGVKQYFTNKFDPLDSAFAKGKAAMDMEGSWAFANWPTYFGPGISNTDYDWFPIPPLRDGVPSNLFALGIGSTLSISSSSKVADAAAEYLNWYYTTPQRMTSEMAAINQEPLPIHIKASDFPSNINIRLRDHYLAINEATAKGIFGYTTWTFWPPKSDVITYDSMDKVLAGNMTPAQFCAELDATFKKEFQQGVVPPIPKGSI